MGKDFISGLPQEVILGEKPRISKGTNMKWTYKKGRKIGQWIVILGCPLDAKHSIRDDTQQISGPSFAECACCEHQVGSGYETLGMHGYQDGTPVYPERLKCGLRCKCEGDNPIISCQVKSN